MAATAGLYGLVTAQTLMARLRIPDAQVNEAGNRVTLWAAEGVSTTRPPIRFALLGDSTSVGYGVTDPHETPGVLMASGISTVARRPVQLNSVGVIGAQSGDLPTQLALLPRGLDLAVIMIGANDVTHRVDQTEAIHHLGDVVAALTERGTEVVVGTCPDLGTVRPLSQPLRFFARRLSRTLAAAQTVTVVAAGGRTVCLGDLLGPLFAADIDMFGTDRFHPSARGYREAANAMLPSCLDALGLRTRARSASTFTSRRHKAVAIAAVMAAELPGSEVVASSSDSARIRRGHPWVQLQRRRAVA